MNWLNFTSKISLKHRFELLLQHICHDGFLSCNQTDILESNFVLNCTMLKFTIHKIHCFFSNCLVWQEIPHWQCQKVGDWICSHLWCFIYDHVYGLFYEYEEQWVIEFAAVLWLNSCAAIWYVPMCMDVPVKIGWIHFQTLTVSIFSNSSIYSWCFWVYLFILSSPYVLFEINHFRLLITVRCKWAELSFLLSSSWYGTFGSATYSNDVQMIFKLILMTLSRFIDLIKYPIHRNQWRIALRD